LASLQGERFITGLIEEIADKLQFKDSAQGLQQAERPHCFVNNVAEHISEFTQHIFHQVAEEYLDNITDKEEAQKLLEQVLIKRMDDSHALNSLPQEEQEMSYQLSITLFEQAETQQQRDYAAYALATLTDIEYQRYDFATALIYAQRFMQGKQQSLWTLDRLSIYMQGQVFNTLKIMGKVSQALVLVKEMTRSLEELDTPESRRDLAVSYAMFAQMAEGRQNIKSALGYFNKGLIQAKNYQSKQQCPDADEIIAAFEGEIQRLSDSDKS